MKQYEKYKHKSYFGIYEHRKPVLVVTDPGLIRQITVTDFDHFKDRGDMFNCTRLQELAFCMFKNNKWESLRTTLLPCFQSENLRFAFYLIEECSLLAIHNLKKESGFSSTIEINIFTYFARFFIDALATTTFGMRPNSVSFKENMFFNHILRVKHINPMLYIVHFLHGNFPGCLKLLTVPLIGNSVIWYFKSLVKEIIEYRRKNNIKHFDIVHMLIEGEDKDKLAEDKKPEQNDSLTDDEIVRQCLTILMDGLFKSSVIATCAVLEIANNPRIQDKLQKEIDTVSGRVRDKSISYDTLKEMDYLDMIIYETLRKWSVEHIIDRVCTKPYTLFDKTTGHSVNLEPGETICIPIAAFHRDANYFSDPEKFYPERFSEDKRGFIRPYTFLPFGIGPRNCIGAKFALMQIKAAMVSLFSEFHVESLSPKAVELTADNKAFFLLPQSNPTVRLLCRKSS
ncbi:unnamed protein product [Hermetia illucens]|uniref:Cytochrome P450 n=2 Tax=Hermetia illucens TaxID=343691 RepID=A0A7R8UNJ5_HERIL|nr:unnamed protein product [Hermetia illucens]